MTMSLSGVSHAVPFTVWLLGVSMTALLYTSLVCHGIFNTLLNNRAGKSQPCFRFCKRPVAELPSSAMMMMMMMISIFLVHIADYLCSKHDVPFYFFYFYFFYSHSLDQARGQHFYRGLGRWSWLLSACKVPFFFLNVFLHLLSY